MIVGNRVFVTGQFTQARPAGAAAGTNETPRSNILAYDLTTGEPDHRLGADAERARHGDQGVGRRIDDLRRRRLRPRQRQSTRSRIAALDAQTGALRPVQPRRRTRGRRARGHEQHRLLRRRLHVGRHHAAGFSRGRVSRPPTPPPARSCRGRRPPTASSTRWSSTRPAAASSSAAAFNTLNGSQQSGMGSLDGDHGRGAAVGREHGHPEPRRRARRSPRSRPTARRSSASAGRTSAAAATANFEGAFSADPVDRRPRLDRRWPGRQLRHRRRRRRALHGRPPARLGHARLEPAVPTRGSSSAPTAIDKHRSPTLTNAYGTSEHLACFAGLPGGAAAALAADADRRHVHRPGPSGVERRHQRRLHRARRRVPARERHRPAGPRAVRQAGDLADGRPDPELHRAHADADAAGPRHGARRLDRRRGTATTSG